MAIRPADLVLGPEEIVDLTDLQKEIDLKLKQFGEFSARRSIPAMVSRSDHHLPLTFTRRPGQRVISCCEAIYRALGWDIKATVHKDALHILIGPRPQTSQP